MDSSSAISPERIRNRRLAWSRRPLIAPLTAIITAAFLWALPAATASAVTLPTSFFGMNWNEGVAPHASEPNQAAQFQGIASTGVSSVRMVFSWADAQPSGTEPPNFQAIDQLVTLAAENHLEVLPTVMYTPDWAAQTPGDTASPPSNPNDYARFLTELVVRYGPNGTFWLQNPTLSPMPIRYWQVWNEPNLRYQWDPPAGESWATSYARLLQTAYPAVKTADPGAQVVLAGTNDSPAVLPHLYSAGIQGYFDIAAIHPYTATAPHVLELTRESRQVMRSNGDGAKPIWVTEITLPASRGKTRVGYRCGAENEPPQGRSCSLLQTTNKGMASFLTATYATLARHARKLGIARIYWYDWASRYAAKGRDNIVDFDYAGLIKWHGGSSFTRKPAYRAFVKALRRFEG